MGTYGYRAPTPQVIIGSKDSSDTITGAALTTSYDTSGVASKVMTTGGASKVELNISYTVGASETLNTLEVRVESSPDNVNFYQLVNETISSGTSTLNQREWTITQVGTTTTFALPVNVSNKWHRISCKETGVDVNAGNVFIEAVRGE